MKISARAAINAVFQIFGLTSNTRRPNSSLDRQTPDQAYFNRLPQLAAA
jgi:hypothetical protein